MKKRDLLLKIEHLEQRSVQLEVALGALTDKVEVLEAGFVSWLRKQVKDSHEELMRKIAEDSPLSEGKE